MQPQPSMPGLPRLRKMVHPGGSGSGSGAAAAMVTLMPHRRAEAVLPAPLTYVLAVTERHTP